MIASVFGVGIVSNSLAGAALAAVALFVVLVLVAFWIWMRS